MNIYIGVSGQPIDKSSTQRTVLGVGMTRYVYAYTTQMAYFIRV